MADIKGNMNSSKVIALIALAIAIISIGFATYQYSETQKLKTSEGQKQVAESEAKVLKDKVARLMQLPEEKPTVATISDISKLKDQAFFNGAKNGDKVLIFTEARKAVIYREDTNRIINSGPIAVTSDQSTSKATSVLASKDGSASDASSKLASVQGITVVTAKAKKNYTKTQVVAIDNASADKAKEVAAALGGEVINSIPSGETAPSGAAIVVFVKR